MPLANIFIPASVAHIKNRAAAYISNPATVGNSALRYIIIGLYT